jgi:predicted Zn-dependent peptidase
VSALALALLLAAPPAVPPPAPFAPPLPTETVVGELRVITLPRHDLPLVHLALSLRAGADRDPEGQPGLAAATALMVAEGGAGNLDAAAMALAFEELGTRFDVSAGPDTATASVSVQSKHLEAAMALLADAAIHPRLDPVDWAVLRPRRLAEVVRRRDEPRTIAELTLAETLFGPTHPYGRPLLGTEASLGAMAPKDVKAFHAAHWVPGQAALVLVGDFDPDDAKALVARFFGAWKGRGTAAPALPTAAAKPSLVLVDRPGAPQSEVIVAGPGVARGAPDYPAAALVATDLGGSFTSRLMQNLREKHGYTYGVRAAFAAGRGAGAFTISSAIRTDATGPALAEIDKELRAIRAELPDAEADKVRSLARQQMVETFATGAGTAQALAWLAGVGVALDAPGKLLAAQRALSGKDLAAVAGRLLPLEGATVIVVGDRKAIEPALKASAWGKGFVVKEAAPAARPAK